MGPARYVDVYIPILDTLRPLPLGISPAYTYMPWAHNIFLEQLGERGLLGFIVFIIPVVVAWRFGTIRKRAALTAFLVMGLFDLTFLKPWVVGTYWALVSLEDRT
jgi:O-antigen ligase